MYNSNVSNLDHILSSLQCYVQSARVRSDVFNLLRQIPSLQPQCGTFTHNDGTTSTLLHLVGTIPIFYRGNQYNIPMEIWMVEVYPTNPPVCFVRPTHNMMIKPGHPHVTADGFVNIQYTSQWNRDHTLVELIAHLCSIFGSMPPVFKRPSQPVPAPTGYGNYGGGYPSGSAALQPPTSQSPVQPSMQQPSASYGMYPGSFGGSSSSLSSSTNPYQPLAASMPMPQPSTSMGAYASGSPSDLFGMSSSCGSAMGTPSTGYGSNLNSGTGGGGGGGGAGMYGASNHLNNATSGYPPYHVGNGYSPSTSPSMSMPMPMPMPMPTQEDPQKVLKSEATRLIRDHFEKSVKRIRDDIDLQFEHQLALTDSHEKVQKGMDALDRLQRDLVEAHTKIAQQEAQVTNWLEAQATKPQVDPDEILVPADAMAKQMIETLAEHLAFEDAMYFMDRALSNGELDLPTFLKEIRKLARKQFMCQALIQKIAEKQQQLYNPVVTQ